MRQEGGISNRIYYEICSQCNLSCIHCNDLLKNEKNITIATEKLVRFHKNMTKRFGCNQAIITGGEPSLHKDFYYIIENLAKISDVLITTNGTVLNSEKIATILSSNSNVILQISVDGLSKETFEKVRGNNVHHVVFNLIDTLVNYGVGKQVGISMTILKNNVNEVMSMVDFCEEKKLGYIHFPTLLPCGKALSSWKEIAPSVEEQLRVEEELFLRISKTETELQISSNRLEQILSRIIPGYMDCKESFTLKVKPDGSIMPCPVAYKDEHKIGNIDDEGVEDVLLEHLKKIKNNSIVFQPRELESCNSCFVKQYCKNSFCSNCYLLGNENNEINKYFCDITSYHLISALKGCADE